MIEDISKLDLIKCPTCGAEYLPVEIFIPEEFFGRPKSIKRDKDHKIISIVNTATCPREQYICDYCNVPFKVSAKMQFITKADTKFDFDSEYTTTLKKESLFLNED